MEFTAVDKNLKNGANMGSIAQYIYFAKYEDVATWPTRPTNPTTSEENGVLTGRPRQLCFGNSKVELAASVAAAAGER